MEALEEQVGIFTFREVHEATSTNDVVKEAIDKGAPEGFAVRADIQSGGYGRQGRFWSSPEGGVYLSVLLRPFDHIGNSPDYMRKLPTLSLITGLAVRRALINVVNGINCDSGDALNSVYESFSASQGESDGYKQETGALQFPSILKVKWPNDLVIENADARSEDTGSSQPSLHTPMFNKICGISLEQHNKGICIGMGVNVFRPKPECANEGNGVPDLSTADGRKRNTPAYLEDFVCSSQIDRSHGALNDSVLGASEHRKQLTLHGVCRSMLAELSAYYIDWLAKPFSEFVSEYESSCILVGHNVRIERNDGSVEADGKVIGIDEFGRLKIVSPADGRPIFVSSGEAHVIM